MSSLLHRATTRNSFSVHTLPRPRIVPSNGCTGWYVFRADRRHAWLVGDRRQAVATFHELDAIERRGRA
jgi:hypothetical protein